MDRAQAFLFDLDGTLVDSVYQHVLAWRDALNHLGIDLSVWRIHRKVGMSGGLFANALLRETGREVTREQAAEPGACTPWPMPSTSRTSGRSRARASF